MDGDLHKEAADWQRLTDFARSRGWTADLPRGFQRSEKSRSVVFGPALGASLEQLREVARRIIPVKRYGEQHGARWRS
jgi:hypothetical protein